jgi:hypothetical protein
MITSVAASQNWEKKQFPVHGNYRALMSYASIADYFTSTPRQKIRIFFFLTDFHTVPTKNLKKTGF